MTLRIDVNVPPRLIERAREQQVERRLAKVAEQRQAVVRKEAARQVVQQRLAMGQDSRGEEVRGGGIEEQRRQWFGAGTMLKYYTVAGCVFNRETGYAETLLNRDARMYEHRQPRTDAETTLTYAPGIPGVDNDFIEVYLADYYIIENTTTTEEPQRPYAFSIGYLKVDILLPVGGGLVLLYKPKEFTYSEIETVEYALDTSKPHGTDWPATIIKTVKTDYTPRPGHDYDRAFMASPNKFKEIPAPSSAGQAIRALIDRPYSIYGLANTGTYDSMGMHASRGATAAVYEVSSPATTQENGRVGICDDITDPSVIRFFYSKNIDQETGRPASTEISFDLDTDRYVWTDTKYRRLIHSTVVPRQGISEYDFSFVWDSGRPDFCRQQLLSLGLSSEDLTL